MVASQKTGDVHFLSVGTRLDQLLRQGSSSPSAFFYVLAYTVLALTTYAYASYGLAQAIEPLRRHCQELEERLSSAKKLRSSLADKVESLSDPAADEYALLVELGRIPEGSRKVLLEPEP